MNILNLNFTTQLESLAVGWEERVESHNAHFVCRPFSHMSYNFIISFFVSYFLNVPKIELFFLVMSFHSFFFVSYKEVIFFSCLVDLMRK